MNDAVIAAAAGVLAALAAYGFGPAVAARLRPAAGRRGIEAVPPAYDPGRERRAERRARELLRSVVSAEEYSMYVDLGFVSVDGGGDGYAYLVYPHRPIVAYDSETGELLNEYCVEFADRSEPRAGSRLPDADDVLAKWMCLRGGERELIGAANMHVPGRQLDPDRVRRDLHRLAAWRGARRRERVAA